MKKIYVGIMAGLAISVLTVPVHTFGAETVEVVEETSISRAAGASDDQAQDEQTDPAEETPATYTVSFNANKGKKVKTTLTLTAGQAYGTLPKTTRTGYTLRGWYTKKSGGVKVTAKTLFTLDSDQVLYAHWKKVVVQEEIQSVVQEAAPQAKLVNYAYGTAVSYKSQSYSNFLVLKNFKPEYLYCQYNYSRFVSNGKNVGCTATADAMLASIYTDKAFSPNDEGWISGVGATWTNSVVASGTRTYTVQQQCQTVYDYLNEGKPVLIRVIGHSVTAIGIRSGVTRDTITPADILIADPGDGKVKCANEMGYRVMTPANGWGLRIPKASLTAAN
jgi:uncharacterized repeat protein (TIGR02543 family)